jgi:hypothetical protein
VFVANLDAQTWFTRANQFEFVALTLGAPPFNKQVPYAMAHIVLRAFSAELFLKCALTLEGKQPKRIHNLSTLFKALSPKARSAIRKRWNVHSRHKLLKLREMKDRPAGKVHISLDAVLRECADAFVEWRYLPAEANMKFSLMNFPLCVREHILTVRPEWRPNPDQLAFDPEAEFAEPENDRFGAVTTGAAILNPKAPTVGFDRISIRRANPNNNSAR